MIARRAPALWFAAALAAASGPAPARAQEEAVFDRPAVDGVAVDWCLNWAADCGQPAADRFCRDRGFPRASRFEIAEDIGRTRVQGTGQACDDPRCDSFRFIACAPAPTAGAREADPRARDPAAGGAEGADLAATLEALSPRAREALLSFITAPDLAPTRLEVLPEFRPLPGAIPNTQSLVLDWNRSDIVARFRWSTDAAGVAGGLWELSTQVFPVGGASSRRPEGLLATGEIGPPRPGNWREFTIDLAAHSPVPPWGRGVRGAPGEAAPERRGRSHIDPNRARPALFLRVRAVDAEGRFVGMPSNMVTLAFGQPRPGRGQLPPPEPGINVPRIRIVRQIPIRPYAWDFQCRGIVRFDHSVWKKGTPINLCGSGGSSSFLEDIGDAVADAAGGMIELASSVVNGVAKLYEDAKAAVVGVVTDALGATVGCPGYCQWAVATGLEAGLAAAGMPPSLPNFDELVANLEQQGIEAVAGEVVKAAASQGVQIPPEVAEAAVEQMVGKAKLAAAGWGGGGGGGNLWFGVDPAGLYSPAVIVLELINDDPTRPTTPINMQLDASSPTSGVSLYALAIRVVPPLQPKSSITLAFELTPSLDPAYWMRELPTAKDIVCSSPSSISDFGGRCDLSQWNAKREKARAALDSWAKQYRTGAGRFRVGFELNPGVHTDVAVLLCPPQGNDCAMEAP